MGQPWAGDQLMRPLRAVGLAIPPPRAADDRSGGLSFALESCLTAMFESPEDSIRLDIALVD